MKHWPLVHNDHLDLEAFSLEDGGSFLEVLEPGVAYACVLTEGQLVATRAGGQPVGLSPRCPVLLGEPGTYIFTASGPCAGMRGTLHPLVSKPLARRAREITEAIGLGSLLLGCLVAWSNHRDYKRR